MSTNNNNSVPLLNFTLAAAFKVKSLIEEEGNLSLHLRVYITGGGCSGFQYGFTFDDVINNDDIVIEKQLRANNNAEEDEEDDGGGNSGSGGFSSGSVKLSNDVVIEKQLSANNNAEEDEEDEEDDDGGDSGSGGFSLGSVKLLVDPMSYTYLQGAEIDYREDAAGAQFVIKNPNAKTTCGCGSSFSA